MDDTSTAEPWLQTGGSGTGVLLCHPWWGISAGVRGMATRIAEAGFLVVMPDLYDGRTASTPDDAMQLRTTFPLSVRQARFNAAVRYLLDQPHRNDRPIGVIGLSMGAAWALGLAATQPGDVGRVVLYYGTGDPEERFHDPTFAVLAHFAEHDDWESESDIAALERNLSRAGIPFQPHVYPGTKHWFAESDVTEAYDPDAAEEAMERTISFLRTD